MTFHLPHILFRRRKHLFHLIAVLAAMLSACANIVRPTGGPKDEKGPEIKYVFPDHLTRNFSAKEIVIEFDEYIKPGSYADEVFISPIPETKPEVLVKGKTLTIRFQSDLKSATTYVVTIGKGIKDANEGNAISKPILYAFSTGSEIDTVTFGGKVTDFWSDKGADGMTVLLYLADSVEGNQFFEEKPMYAAPVLENGAFSFMYVKPDVYKIFAVRDADKSYTWNQKKEQVAFNPNPLIDARDSSAQERVLELVATLRDETPPAVKSAKWLNASTLEVEFKEAVIASTDSTLIDVSMSDTTGAGGNDVPAFEFLFKSKTKMVVQTGRPSEQPSLLHIRNMVDTLGNTADTSLLLLPAPVSKKSAGKCFRDPIVNPTDQEIILQALHPLQFPVPDSMFMLLDTGGKEIPSKIEATEYQVKILPLDWPKHKITAKLRVQPRIQFQDTVPDSSFTFPIAFPEPDEFGELSGSIVTAPGDSIQKWILLLYTAGKGGKLVQRTEGELNFSFSWLAPGKYDVVLIQDNDANKVWSPGDPDSGIMPERVVRGNEQIEIRAKWKIEEYKALTTPPVKQRGIGEEKPPAGEGEKEEKR